MILVCLRLEVAVVFEGRAGKAIFQRFFLQERVVSMQDGHPKS